MIALGQTIYDLRNFRDRVALMSDPNAPISSWTVPRKAKRPHGRVLPFSRMTVRETNRALSHLVTAAITSSFWLAFGALVSHNTGYRDGALGAAIAGLFFWSVK